MTLSGAPRAAVGAPRAAVGAPRAAVGAPPTAGVSMTGNGRQMKTSRQRQTGTHGSPGRQSQTALRRSRPVRSFSSSSRLLLTLSLTLLPSLFLLAALPSPCHAAHFVLVHGWFQGPWVWSKVQSRLEKAGHDVTVVQLPGRGGDDDEDGSAPLQSNVDVAAPVLQVLRDAAEPVVLVGHSYGGVVISTAAEEMPTKVERLVYVAAFLLPTRAYPMVLLGPGMPLLKQQSKHLETKLAITPQSAVRTILYSQCKSSDRRKGEQGYRDEPLAPLYFPLNVTVDRWGSVKRYYVYTELDNSIIFNLQRFMVVNGRVLKTWFLRGADATPQLSTPTALTRVLLLVLLQP